MDQIIVSLKSRGLLLASSVRPGFFLSACNSGKFVLILVHYSSVPNMIYPAMLGFWYLSEWLLVKTALEIKDTVNKNAKLLL